MYICLKLIFVYEPFNIVAITHDLSVVAMLPVVISLKRSPLSYGTTLGCAVFTPGSKAIDLSTYSHHSPCTHAVFVFDVRRL